MNLVESRTGGGDESGGNRTGGEYMLQVDMDWHDGGGYVVAYMDSVFSFGEAVEAIDWW